jgi:MFS family permease
MEKTEYFSKPNKVIRFLILSDVSLIAGLGFISPVFAIFLSENIRNGGAEVAGFAAATYWIIESIIVIPAGWFLDRNHGEKDDLWFITIGNLLAAAAVIGYVFSTLPWHIYALQAIYAVGMGMNIPGYSAIFTRHIDKGKEASNWSIRSSSIGFCTGIAGALGGIIVKGFGFNALFIGAAFFIILSSIIPFFIKKNMSPKNIPTVKTPTAKTIQPPIAKNE